MILQNGKLVNSLREKLITQAVLMAMWILFALNLYFAIVQANAGRIVMTGGSLLALSALLLCGPAIKLVELEDNSKAARVILGACIFGFMIAVTGGLIQLTHA